eukprot:1021608_1
MSSEDGNHPDHSLNEIQLQFQKQLGHLPHTEKQILAYCKQNNLPFKYSQISRWWPKRANPEAKPFQQAVNAFVDHSSQFNIPYLLCTGYIRLHLTPQITRIVPLDIIYEIYKFYDNINSNKPIFLKRANDVNPTSEVFCINMNDDHVKFTKTLKKSHNTGSFADGRTHAIAHINAMDIHLKYPSILNGLLRLNAVAPSPYLRLNCIFECGGDAYSRTMRRTNYSALAIMVTYQSSDLQNALCKVDSLSNTAQYVEYFTKRIGDLPARGTCSVAYDVEVGLIVACNREVGKCMEQVGVCMCNKRILELHLVIATEHKSISC